MQNYYWRGLKYCIISKNYTTTKNCHMSKALTTLVRELRLKDAWFVKIRRLNLLIYHLFVMADQIRYKL